MFKQVEPLLKENHQDLRFTAAPNFQFAAESNTAPLAFSEFALASKYYPIVFLKETISPVVILSLEKKKNGFVTPEGAWTVPYVPAHFRRYPFMLAKVKNPHQKENGQDRAPKPGEEKMVLCIDREAPQFVHGQGELLFTANGEFTDFVKKQVEFLTQFQNEMNMTSALIRQIHDKDVLVDRSFHVNANGRTVPVGGFSVVDMNRVAKLEDAVLADWVRRGIMSLITSHLNSLVGIPMGQGA